MSFWCCSVKSKIVVAIDEVNESLNMVNDKIKDLEER